MLMSTVTSKGQTTIPKEIRDHLHLHAGDRLKFVIGTDGRVILLAATIDIKELHGILPKPKKPVSLDDIERAIKKRGSRAGN